ncbi:hypothetical protein ACFQ69_02700 [Streptomyces sp. NPDC056470]|uniref:hypothetical protein n=1 Tax=Streptomyces sp. NPDC056470 TaxID=3345831 RepID=UPI0036B87972
MFHRIRRRSTDLEITAIQRQQARIAAWLAVQVPPVDSCQPTAADVGPATGPTSTVDDFLPADLRVPSHDQLEGRVMPRPQPLVFDDEIVTCTECGEYRDWLILSTRDEIWLRCRAGHQQVEPRLDTTWYNRAAGPADATHATFEDCLRHLGH